MGQDMNDMAFFNGGEEVLERLRQLFVKRDPEVILAAMFPPNPAVPRFAQNHRDGFCEYPEPQERADFWADCLKERAKIQDDSVPTAYLSEMDQALYGGLVGGKAQFLCDASSGWISSMVEPILHDLAELDQLRVDINGEWIQRYRRHLAVFAESAHGRYGLSHFILIDGLNFAFELVGATKSYEALLDRPELVRRVIDFAFDLNVMVQKMFFDSVPQYHGGTCSNMIQWHPGRIVSESVDPFHMTSVDYFEEWGRPNIERMFAAFDGGAVHIHGNGRHLLEAVSTLKGLKAMCLCDDRGFPPAFEVLPELKRRVGAMPVLVATGYDSFRQALDQHRLIGGVFYSVGGVLDVAAANRLMDQVRSYRVS